jgi:predicted chitinase
MLKISLQLAFTGLALSACAGIIVTDNVGKSEGQENAATGGSAGASGGSSATGGQPGSGGSQTGTGGSGSGGDTGSGSGGTVGAGGDPGAGGSSGGGGSGGEEVGGEPIYMGDCVLNDLIGQAKFNNIFPDAAHGGVRVPFYSYASLCDALKNPSLSHFANEGSTEDRKREVAAFLANVKKETWGLHYIDQSGFDPNGEDYHGRGPLQLTTENNYSECGNFLGIDLTGSGQTKLSTDPIVSWQASLCFWLSLDSGQGQTCHEAIVGQQSFGRTIRIINGIECGGTQSATDRKNYFLQITNTMSVDPGTDLGC